MDVRPACADDAETACVVLRRSIAELYHSDHRNDDTILNAWLRNKTPAVFAGWVDDPDNHLFVAREGPNIVAVGAVTTAGEITLNYVSPDARFKGISKMMLQRLEAKARELGNSRCTLTSTETAHRFYLAAGYQDQEAPVTSFNTTSYPMAKALRTRQPS